MMLPRGDYYAYICPRQQGEIVATQQLFNAGLLVGGVGEDVVIFGLIQDEGGESSSPALEGL